MLDTNVLVSGLLSPYGAPGAIVRMLSSGVITICFDARIITEYEEVLARPRFDFDANDVAALLDYAEACGESVAPGPLVVTLPDPDDQPFLEVAAACAADALVTGNIAHSLPGARTGVTVLTPAEFVEHYRTSARTCAPD